MLHKLTRFCRALIHIFTLLSKARVSSFSTHNLLNGGSLVYVVHYTTNYDLLDCEHRQLFTLFPKYSTEVLTCTVTHTWLCGENDICICVLLGRRNVKQLKHFGHLTRVGYVTIL